MKEPVLIALSALALVSPLAVAFAAAPSAPPMFKAQAEGANPAEFTLTAFTDATRGWTFQRPTSWTQDATVRDAVRFNGGDESLELRVTDDKTVPKAYAAGFKLPALETKLGVKPFKVNRFSSFVISSKRSGSSVVTGKLTELLTDRWVFSPKSGKLAVLTVTGPTKVFDWEGNRDMALSVRVK